MANLSIVVVNYNTAALLRECLTSIAKTLDMNTTEIIVVDNASVDDSVTVARHEFPSVRLMVQAENLGFCAANNLGVAASSAPYVMLLNSDAVLLGDAGRILIRYLEEHRGVNCVGPRIVLPNGEPQPRVFGNLPTLWRIAMQSLYFGALFPRVPVFEGVDGRHRSGPAADVGWISGVCMVIRRLDFIAVGGFDPTFFMYCEDVDLCWRLSERGGTIVRMDSCELLHYGGGSSPSIAGQLRNSLLQQRNLLKIVRNRSSRSVSRAASFLIFIGLLLRLVAGSALLPTRGLRGNILLRSSWLRILDFIRPAQLPSVD